MIIGIFILAGALAYTNEATRDFPVGSILTIKSGDTLSSVAKNLKAEHYIRSTTLFKSSIILFAGQQKLIAGDYYFSRPLSVYAVASRLVSGNFDLAKVRVTIPEGLSMQQTAKILSAKLLHFDEAGFMKYSPQKEGYLFPDTYFFMPNASVDEVISTMENNFKDKIKSLETKIKTFGKTEKEVVTMASILEEEGKTMQDWQIIAGILWKRIKIGMPLQVDASLGYVTGRASSQLTTTDLKSASPYNTYTHRGLPPTPIANPGIKTLEASVTPIPTTFLYYLSDKNDVIHYASTFEQHIKNREKYLK